MTNVNDRSIKDVCLADGATGAAYSTSNPVPISGSFSATLSGFAPGAQYATLAVTTASARVALPAGTVVVVYNDGPVNVYTKLGTNTVTATTSMDVIVPGSWVAYTVGTNTYLAGITKFGAAALILSGGSGLATGGGGDTLVGMYNASGVTLTDTQRAQLQLDADGSVYVRQRDLTLDAIAPVVSTALESSHVLKASAGALYDIQCWANAAGILMLFDATSAPSNGAVTPLLAFNVAQYGEVHRDFTLRPVKFSTGIVACFSTTTTTPFTLALGSNAFFSARVE